MSQNMLEWIGKLTEQDMRHITWWVLRRAKAEDPTLTLHHVALLNREKLKKDAKAYFRKNRYGSQGRHSSSQPTYRKLFGENK